MSNSLQTALLNGLAADILNQLAPQYPLLMGKVIALSDYGKSMWDEGIAWTNYSMVANFVPVSDAPFNPGTYGTVAIVEEINPRFIQIITEACSVPFNHKAFMKMEANGTVIDYYTAQLTAKVQAWDALVNAILLFGNAQAGTPGLLNGSGIPIISSTVDLSLAATTTDQIINEIVRIATAPSRNSEFVFKPTLVGMPSNLWDLLNRRSYSATNSETVLEVILRRLNSSAGYSEAGEPKFTVTAVPQFNANKLMTVLPENPNEIGAAVFDLVEFDCPNNGITEYGNGKLASSHEGGYAGVIAKRPTAGCLGTLTYTA